jgi:resuscitation-promoting factor RpfB
MRKHRVSTLPLAAAIAAATISASGGQLGAAVAPRPSDSALAGRTAGQVGSLLVLDSLVPSGDSPAAPSGTATIALASLPVPPPVPVPVAPLPVTFPLSAGPPIIPASTTPAASGVWARLRQCESGGNYATDTGNGYFGAYQFSEATWLGIGGTGYPDDAPPAVQDQAAQRLQARSGWGQWPACSRQLGL